MVEYSRDPLSVTFYALSNPIRREIVALLNRAETSSVQEIAAYFEISLNGVSKHLKVLENAGLLRREIRGRIHLCSLVREPLVEAEEWITYYRQFWHNRLDALERVLETRKQQAPGESKGS